MPASLPPALQARFRPVRILAAGGYGDVWLAEQVNLSRMVALKVLQSDAMTDPKEIRRFGDEAKIAASISHPNVVIVLDHGLDDGTPWIAYEYIEGRTLRDALMVGPMDWTAALDAARQIAAALAEAHAHGILHRDVKPDNVLEASPGTFKVTDFGIAKWAGAERRHTRTGDLMGSPSYISPEQIRGGEIGPACDVYGLGCTLFELLTGRLPFPGLSVAAVLNCHLNTPPPAPSEVRRGLPAPLDPLVQKAMAKEPGERFATAAEMREAIDMFIGSSDAMRLPGEPGPRGRRTAKAIATMDLPNETALRRALKLVPADASDAALARAEAAAAGLVLPAGAPPWLPRSRALRVLAALTAGLALLTAFIIVRAYVHVPDRDPAVSAGPQVERVLFDSDGLDVTVTHGERTLSQRFPPPSAYPYLLTITAPDAQGVFQVAETSLAAREAAAALLAQIAGLPAALAQLPADERLRALARERKKLDPAELRKRVEAELPKALTSAWRALGVHARPLLAANLPLVTGAKIVEGLSALEDVTLRLRAFQLPAPISLANAYPPRWAPGLMPPAAGAPIPAELEPNSAPASEARALIAELHAAPEVGGFKVPVAPVCATRDIAGRTYPRDRLQGLFEKLVHEWVGLGAISPQPVPIERFRFEDVLPPRYRATVNVPPKPIGQAWIAIALRPRLLASLRIHINGLATVRLAPSEAVDLAANAATMAYHSFDPRALLPGANELVVDAVGVLALTPEPPWTGFDSLAIGITESH